MAEDSRWYSSIEAVNQAWGKPTGQISVRKQRHLVRRQTRFVWARGLTAAVLLGSALYWLVLAQTDRAGACLGIAAVFVWLAWRSSRRRAEERILLQQRAP
jgi:hypothetical protein